MDLSDKSQLLQYLKEKGLWAKKALGQNFLVDREALNKIVEAAELKSSDFVVEVGSGTGVLTSELVKKAGEVLAVEKDDKLAELLKEQFCHSREDGNLGTGSQIRSGMTTKDNLKVINADILNINLNELIGDRKYKVVANIPYYITSKIIELFLTAKNKPDLIVLLVQKEVAERICAKPGEMSVLSVSVQLYGKPQIVDIVPKESFFPAPKVDSAILRIAIPKSKILNSKQIQNSNNKNSKQVSDLEFSALDLLNEKSFFRLVHIGFASRRKTLANNLSSGYLIDKRDASDIIKSIGLNENIRAQELNIEDWRKLCSKMLISKNQLEK